MSIIAPNNPYGQLGSPPPWHPPQGMVYPDNTLKAGDLLVRKAANGWLVIVVGTGGKESEAYVAPDIDKLADVLKLAAVNRELKKAK